MMGSPEDRGQPRWRPLLLEYDAALARGETPSRRLVLPEGLAVDDIGVLWSAQECLRRLEQLWPRSDATYLFHLSTHGEAAALIEELGRSELRPPSECIPSRPVTTVAELAEAVTASEILAPADMDQVLQDLEAGEQPATTASLAYELVQRRILTAPQARSLCRRDLHKLLLGDYLVLEELGRGGMGIVYKAWHVKRKIFVALKTLHFADPESIARLKREFRILAGQTHPNLLRTDELRLEDGRWFFTMELVDGRHITSYVLGDPLPAAPDATPEPPACGILYPEQLARLRDAACQLVRGLLALHASDVLHRDIKPSNVLVRRDGRVVLADFGMALPLSEMGAGERMLEGTWAYMSPEQMECQPLTPASDWYSVGVVLYGALFGRLPFRGTFTQIREAKRAPQPPIPWPASSPEYASWLTLCKELLQPDPASRPNGNEVLLRLSGDHGTVSPPRLRPRGPEPEPVFVGRHGLLDSLHRAYRRAAEGATLCVRLHGASGMGKTALIERFLGQLPTTALKWSSRCYARESHAYKAMESVIESLGRFLAANADVRESVGPEGWAALTRVFPALKRWGARTIDVSGTAWFQDEREVRRRAMAALRELLELAARQRPLVLFFDDLQWGDVDSATMLAGILAPPVPNHILCIAAYRSEEATRSLCLRWLDQELQEAEVEQIELPVPPLDEGEARNLVRALLTKEDPRLLTEAATLVGESDGNPYLIRELACWLQQDAGAEAVRPPRSSEGPLSEMLSRRIQTLSHADRNVLNTIAIAGHPLRWDDVLTATEAGAEAHLSLRALCSQRFVRHSESVDGESVEPFHDRIRETTVASLSVAEQAWLHRRLAETLESRGDSPPEQLFAHYRAAGAEAESSHYAEQAADEAAGALAFEHAARLYQAALEASSIPPARRTRLLRRRGDVLANAGRGLDAAETYRDAIGHARPEERLELRRLAANQFLRMGRIDEGRPLLRETLRDVGLPYPRTALSAVARFIFDRCWVRLRGLRYTLRPRHEISARDVARLEACWTATSSLGMIDAMRGMAFAARHISIALSVGEPVHVCLALIHDSAMKAFAGSRRDEGYALAEVLAARLNDPYVTGALRQFQGLTESALGRWRTAVALSDESVECMRRHGGDVFAEVIWSDAVRLMALYFLGDFHEIRRRVLESVAHDPHRGDPFAAVLWRSYFGVMAWLAADQVDEARRQVAKAQWEWALGQPFYLLHLYGLVGRLSVAVYAGEGMAAWDGLQAVWPAFRRSFHYQHQVYRIIMLHLRARAALMAVEQGAPRRSLLREARRAGRKIVAERQGWAGPLGRMILAATAVHDGDREKAAELLRRAADEFQQAEMPVFAAAARLRRSELGPQPAAVDQRQADVQTLLDHGVKDPDRMLRFLAPGFAGP